MVLKNGESKPRRPAKSRFSSVNFRSSSVMAAERIEDGKLYTDISELNCLFSLSGKDTAGMKRLVHRASSYRPPALSRSSVVLAPSCTQRARSGSWACSHLFHLSQIKDF